MKEVNVSRLMFSALERNAGPDKLGIRERVSNSTVGGAKGLGYMSRMEAYSSMCNVFDSLMTKENNRARFTNSAASYGDSQGAVGQISVGIDATIRAYVDSMAGFFCREESINAPNALVTVFDALDVFDDTVISPNLGPIAYNKLRKSKPVATELAVAGPSYTFNPGKKIHGKSVKITFIGTTGGKTVAIPDLAVYDDGYGNLLAPAGLLLTGVIPASSPEASYAPSTVNYAEGIVSWAINTNFTWKGVAYVITKINVAVQVDMTGDASTAGTRTHIKGKSVGFLVSVEPELLTYEANLIENVSVSKTLGSDMQVYLSERLAELYTVRINTMIAEAIDKNYVGETLVVNFSDVSFDNTRSYSDFFNNKLIEYGQKAKEKVYRLGTPNVILAGLKGSIPFLKLTSIGVFTRVKNSNINGLIGYLDDVTPVLTSDSIVENVDAVNPTEGGPAGEGIFYMSYKSTDGTVAPLLRVIYLPLTTTPNVGNFANPVQVSGGYYYAENVYPLYAQAIQRVQVFGASKY